MRGASRTSLGAVTDDVRPVLEGARGTDLGEQLFGVVDVLDSSGPLRRALTDPAREASDRTALAERLLGGRVGGEAMDVVRRLVGGRWSASRDLPDAVEQLAVLATVSGASQADDSGDGVDRVEEELFRVERLLSGDRALRAAVADRYAPDDARTGLLERLLGDRVAPGTLLLVRRAAVRSRGLTPERALSHYGELAAEWRRRVVALVTTAVPLRDDQRQRLVDLLSRQYGRAVHVDSAVDPGVVGGVRLEVGGELVDSTVSSRLDETRRRLAR
ncbi:F0F1 ATP synthase subunit delta [uncultured Pseudokineococcus sp.]|uniref:F0F1 ATP synthase subunit delta n=1 Tax=uncultured Pseudokineococcus sp. TaxID=1642928 RepID=UPI00261773F3|nr:F0F1 ATP synthase subunit delta [uncultured Pseudokineococcus sp.]